MTRFHQTENGLIPFTAKEEAHFDALVVQYEIQQVESARTEYQRKREKEYPSINDYVDGIVKGDQAQVQAYIDACLAVKAKYPKPN